jgi:cholesterol transport system auxiliary component
MKCLVPILLAAAIVCGCASGSGWQRRAFAFTSPGDPPSASAQTNIVALTNMVALTRVSISPLFQSRSFTYRTAENSYEQDPYAGFLIPPERALAESIRASMRSSGVFGRVVEPGTGLTPTSIVEVSVNELYGDFRKSSKPVATMEIHFICYEVTDGAPGRIVLDKICASETPLAAKTPAALMAAWDADLRRIMVEINSEYAKASSNNR